MEKQIELAKQLLESKGYTVTKKVNESVDSEWKYYEMPKNYKGPFEYPHYYKQYDENIIGSVFPPYKSDNFNVDSFDDYEALLYDNGSADELVKQNFDNMEDAKKFLDEEYAKFTKRFPKEQR